MQDTHKRNGSAIAARVLALCAITVCLGAGVCFGILTYRATSAERVTGDALLRAVLREVEHHYVEEVPRERLVDNAIRGVLAGLDEHSLLLDERALLTMQEETAGSFGGVGVTLGLVRGRLTIIESLPNTPAARAGIRAGDRLLQVDHQPVRRLTAAAQALRGSPDTNVHVRVGRAAPADTTGTRSAATAHGQNGARSEPAADAQLPATTGSELDFDITRALIALASVHGRVLEPGYGYLRVDQFNENTEDDLATALADLTTAGPLDGLILDLCNNPGGLLVASVAVANAFLTDGVIVSIASRLPESAQTLEANADVVAPDVALAVLVNQGSASASEVVASALQDHRRAVVVGTETYGKASVQSVMHFPKGRRAVKLTTARYRTPAGRSLDNAGVVPDIVVARRADESIRDYRQRVLNAALAHLKGDAVALTRSSASAVQ